MRASILLLALLPLACDWSRFDELSESAPVREITAEGAGSFGDALCGLPMPDSSGGAAGGGLMVVGVGNGTATLVTAKIEASGRGVTVPVENPTAKLADLAGLDSVLPSSSKESGVTRVWLGGTTKKGEGRVWLVNPSTGISVYELKLAGVRPLSLAIADLGPRGRYLVIGGTSGGQGGVVMKELGADGLVDASAPDLTLPIAFSGGTGGFVSLAAGQASGASVVAAGQPGSGRVVLLDATTNCPGNDLNDSCAHILSAADKDFGAAVLLVDLDANGSDPELVVGAPGSDRVLAYSYQPDEATRFRSRSAVTAPAAGKFGAALAWGSVTGAAPVLLVGAPDTPVDGVDLAGVVYLYAGDAAAPLAQVSLASAASGRRLGRHLSVTSFKQQNGQQRDLLAAAGSQAIYLFFEGPGGADVRPK